MYFYEDFITTRSQIVVNADEGKIELPRDGRPVLQH